MDFFTRSKVLNVCGLADFVHAKDHPVIWHVMQGTGPCCFQLFPRNSFQEAADELFVHSRRWLVFNNVAVTLRPAHSPTSTCVTILSSDFQVYRLQFYSLQSLQQFDDWMIRYDDPVFLPPWWFCFVHFAECIALHVRIGIHDGWWLQFLVLWIGNRVDVVSQWMIFWSMIFNLQAKLVKQCSHLEFLRMFDLCLRMPRRGEYLYPFWPVSGRAERRLL
jgi:hypothetical protein